MDRFGSDRIRSFIQETYATETVCDDLRGIAYNLNVSGWALIGISTLLAIFADFHGWYLYLIVGGIGVGMRVAGLTMLAKGEKEIPLEPVSYGLLIIWGMVMKIKFPPMKAFIANYFPFYIDIFVLRGTPYEAKFTFEEVPCAAKPDLLAPKDKRAQDKIGGTVSGDGMFVIVPDDEIAERLMEFQKYSGGIEEVGGILCARVVKAINKTAIRYDWETFVTLKDELRVMLIAQISEIDFRSLPFDEQTGELIDPEQYEKISFAKYQNLGTVKDPLVYLFPEPAKSSEANTSASNARPSKKKAAEDAVIAEAAAVEQKRKALEAKIFLGVMDRYRCLRDNMGLGIMIREFIGPNVDPGEAFRKANAEAASEDSGRVKDRKESETLIANAELFMKFDSSMTKPQAIEYARRAGGTVKETLFLGLGGNVGDMPKAAALMSQNADKGDK